MLGLFYLILIVYSTAVVVLQTFAVRYDISLRRRGFGYQWREEQMYVHSRDPQFLAVLRRRRVFSILRIASSVPYLYILIWTPDVLWILITVAPYLLGYLIAYLSKLRLSPSA